MTSTLGVFYENKLNIDMIIHSDNSRQNFWENRCVRITKTDSEGNTLVDDYGIVAWALCSDNQVYPIVVWNGRTANMGDCMVAWEIR